MVTPLIFHDGLPAGWAFSIINIKYKINNINNNNNK
jgi:hypothetical protein